MSYHKTNVDYVLRYMDKKERGQYWKPKEGTNYIRVLPAYSEEGIFFKEAWYHWRVGEERRTVVCPKHTVDFSKPCPICDLVRSLYDSGDPNKISIAGGLKATPSFYSNIIDLNSPEEGVQIYNSSRPVFKSLMLFFKNRKQWGDFTDPEEGFNVNIERSGTGKATTYSVTLDRDKTPIQDMGWLDKLHNLDEIIKVPTYKELKEALHGSPEELDNDEERPSSPSTVELSDEIVRELAKEGGISDFIQTEPEKEPECFGEEYNKKSSKCGNCAVNLSCVEAFVRNSMEELYSGSSGRS